MRKVLLILLMLVVMTMPVFAACQAAAPQKVTWIQVSADLPFVDAANYFNYDLPELINTASGGAVTVEWRPTLYTDEEFIWPLNENKVQIAQLSLAGFSENIPEWEMSHIPFLFLGPEEYYSFVEGGGFKMYFDDIFKKYNLDMVALSTWSYGTDGLWSKKPVRTVDDFKGMKIHAEAAAKDAVELFGGVAQTVPFEESYLALERGVVDAMLMGATWGVGFGFPDVTPYYADWPIIPFYPQALAINKTAWEALPKDVQTAINDAITQEFTKKMVELCILIYDLEVVLPMLEEVGVTYVELDQAEIAKAQNITKGIIEEWANKTPECMELVRKFEQTSGRTVLGK